MKFLSSITQLMLEVSKVVELSSELKRRVPLTCKNRKSGAAKQ